MKQIKILVVLTALVSLAACGSGSSSGGSADAQAEAAANTFFNIMETCGINGVGQELDAGKDIADVEKQITQCACPGGGTININQDADTIVLTATNCLSDNNQNYNGTITIDVATQTGSVDMNDFGEDCSSVEGANLNFNEGSCAGTITATCTAGTASCTLEEPATAGDGCDAECS
jgi:hypothetical protein